MKILIKKIDGLKLPVQGNPDDACYDIFSTSEPLIVGVKFELPMDGITAWSRIDYIEYKTSLFFSAKAFKRGKQTVRPYIQALPRSSVRKKNMVLANSEATLDHGYRGEVSLCFKYIFQPEDLLVLPEFGRTRVYGIVNPANIYAKGDRIAQIKPCENISMEFELVDNLDETPRGDKGFGSTN